MIQHTVLEQANSAPKAPEKPTCEHGNWVRILSATELVDYFMCGKCGEKKIDMMGSFMRNLMR